MSDGIALAIDDSCLAIGPIGVVFRLHLHNGIGLEPHFQKVERSRIICSHIHRLRFADTDIRPDAFVPASTGN